VSWDFDAAVTRGHGLALGVPNHEAHHIASWRYIERFFHDDTGVFERCQRLVAQVQRYHTLNSFYEIPVRVEQAGDDRHLIVISFVGFAETQAIRFDAGHDCDFGLFVAGLEILRLEIHRNVADFIA